MNYDEILLYALWRWDGFEMLNVRFKLKAEQANDLAVAVGRGKGVTS